MDFLFYFLFKLIIQSTKYTSITKWNNGYIECMAKYSTLDTPIEEYIDLRYIAKRLRLPKDIFDNIKEVKVL